MPVRTRVRRPGSGSRPWVESFDAHSIKARDFIDAGDRVFFEIFQQGRPSGGSTAVEGRWWVVMVFRKGTIARVEVFNERAEALKAAGVSN